MAAFQEPTSGSRRGLLAPEIVNSKAMAGNFKKSMVEGLAENFAHANPNHDYNPPFDVRAWGVPSGGIGPAFSKKLLRGRMGMWKPEPNKLAIADRKRTRSINFFYNPTTISHSFAFSGDLPPPDAMSADDPAMPLMEGQSISWKLLFNRQYEVATGRPRPVSTLSQVPDRIDPGNEFRSIEESGVLADTTALQYMLGTPNNGQAMLSTLIVVMFGATPGNKPFAYYGYIISCDINYLMFNHRMIPTVAEVSLTLARRVMPDTVDDNVKPYRGAGGLAGTSSAGGVTGSADSLEKNGNGGAAQGQRTARTVAEINDANRRATIGLITGGGQI